MSDARPIPLSEVVDAVDGLDVDAVLLDIGGTLVVEDAGATAVTALEAVARPGAVAMVEALAARFPGRVGAVTNTSVLREVDVRALLVPLDLDRHLAVVVTSVDVGVAKPDPFPILEACRLLGIDPTRTAYIGNADTDAQAASAAGSPYLDVRTVLGAGPT